MKTNLLIILLLLMAGFLLESRGQETRYWMILYPDGTGLDFDCASTATYEDIREMSVADYTPYALDWVNLTLRAQVIEVEYCNLDNLYAGRGEDYSFAWRFTVRSPDPENPFHTHFTRGAAWIRLLSFEAE